MAQPAPFCTPGQVPAFTRELASLVDQLQSFMGQPVECEHLDPVSGDILQATTAGLAYYRHAARDTPVFTDGQSHVALTADGLIGWDGASVDGPLWLSRDGALPTWCSWLKLGQQVSGYLCVYPSAAIAAWSPPTDASKAWILLGLEPSPDADWQLTAAGRILLGGAASVTPSEPLPAPDVAPPPDTYVQVSVDPINPSPPPSFGMITGRVCNQSTVWTASDVRLEFSFLDSSLLPTPNRASASLNVVPPDTCAPFAATFSAMSTWQTVRLDRTSFSWHR
jgi:hypothetical protein